MSYYTKNSKNRDFLRPYAQSGSDLENLDALCPVRIRITINGPDQTLGFGISHSAVLSGVLVHPRLPPITLSSSMLPHINFFEQYRLLSRSGVPSSRTHRVDPPSRLVGYREQHPPSHFELHPSHTCLRAAPNLAPSSLRPPHSWEPQPSSLF